MKHRKKRVVGRVQVLIDETKWWVELRPDGLTIRKYRSHKQHHIPLADTVSVLADGQLILGF